MKFEYIKPPVVLTVICAAVSAMLVGANLLTQDRIAAANEEKINQSVKALLGDGEYTVCQTQYEGIDSIIHDEKGQVAMEVTASGYATNGLHLMIALNENGEVSGINFIAISETKGIGTRAQDESFLQQFYGAASDDYQFDALSGATYTSNGMKSAVDAVINTYNQNKEAILSE